MNVRRIEHLVEPERLFLVWQSPDLSGDRTRRVVGGLRKSAGGCVELRYLTETDDFRAARSEGFEGYPAFPLDRDQPFPNVLNVLLRRLPPSSRSDYSRYLESLCLSPDSSVSPFALLGYSGAMLPSDSFSVAHPFDDAPVPCEFLLEVAGVRHYWSDEQPVAVGAAAHFVPEPTNPRDPLAVRIDSDSRCIGYVARPQTRAVQDWLNHAEISAEVHRVNGIPERRRILLFVRVRQRTKAAA